MRSRPRRRPAATAPPRRPDPVEQYRAAETNKPKLRRARFFGTPAPRGIPPARNAGEKARPRPQCCFGATDLVGELPRSNGQTTAWPSRARVRVTEEEIGRASCRERGKMWVVAG